ncbi:MAG: DUF2839 domain-containing protein [Cyanobacteriota bacterium]|nr:DUF2839 domain-containing protein [Cyanobacteriota bacterium]
MGDAKRRKEELGSKYGDPDQELLFPRLKDIPITKGQARQFYQWSTQGAWAGIILLMVYWVVIRFVGPAFGWWHLTPLE